MGFFRRVKIAGALEGELSRRNVKLWRKSERNFSLVNRTTGGWGGIHPGYPDIGRVTIYWIDDAAHGSPPGYYVFADPFEDPIPLPPPVMQRRVEDSCVIGPYGDERLAAITYLVMLDCVASKDESRGLPPISKMVADAVGIPEDELFG